MKSYQKLYAASSQEWKAWLEKNHDKTDEIWLIYYKKKSGWPSINHDDALDEALCYGWVDSLIKNIDKNSYMRKFTPRTNVNKWSALNIKKAKKLIVTGRMTEYGLAKIPEDILNSGKEIAGKGKKIAEIPEFIMIWLAENKTARDNFSHFPPSSRELYIRWIMNAKKEGTRLKRLEEAVGLIEKNVKRLLK